MTITNSSNKSARMKFNELLIGGYLRTEVLPSLEDMLYIPLVLTQLITSILFHTQTVHESPVQYTRFEWGYHATYWDTNDMYYIKAKHKNLKQELFRNSIFRLTAEQWKHTLSTSKMISKSFISNKMRAKYRPKWNILTNILPGKNINLKHIVALKIYSDYDQLSHRFSKVLQSNDTELKGEIAHFARLIIEAVHLYGIHWSSNSNLKLYHAVNNSDIVLDTVYPTAYFPFSATSSVHVAKTFATENGTTLQLNGTDSKGPIVLDLSLLSDYPEEEAWIVMNDKFTVDSVNKNSDQSVTQSDMQKIQFAQRLLNGSFLVDRDGNPLPNYEENMKVYTEMMRNYVYSKLFGGVCITSDLQQMFNLFMDKRRHIFMNDRKVDEMNGITDIFIKYHYKFVSMPILKWNICDEAYDTFKNGDIMQSERIKGSIDHLIKDCDDLVTFQAQCRLNEQRKFEFELEIVEKSDNIKYVEYEYEMYIESMPFYYTCGHCNSHCKQYNIFESNKLFDNNSSLKLNIAIRILKCYDFQDQVIS